MPVSKGLHVLIGEGKKRPWIDKLTEKQVLFYHLVLKYECLGSIKTTLMVLSACYKLVA